MYFLDYDAAHQFLVELPSIKPENNLTEESSVSLTYLDGTTDTAYFGSRRQFKTTFRVINIPFDHYSDVFRWAQAHLGTNLGIIQDPNEFLFGPAFSSENLTIQIVEARALGESGWSEDREMNAIEFDCILVAEDGVPVNDNVPTYNFLVEIDINAVTTDYSSVQTPADISAIAPDPQLGENIAVLNYYNVDPASTVLRHRYLMIWNGTTWEIDFPLSEQEVTFWIRSSADWVEKDFSVLKDGMTRFFWLDRVYETYRSGGPYGTWVSTPFPQIPPYKPIVANVASLGMRGGKLYWASFADFDTDPESFYQKMPPKYVSGIIANEGIDFPNLRAAIETGPCVENLEGFKVKISNAKRFHWTSLGFNFFGALCRLYVVHQPLSVFYTKVLIRTGINTTNSLDFSNYEFNADPSFFMDSKKQLPYVTIEEKSDDYEERFAGQFVPITYGRWSYAKLQPAAQTNEPMTVAGIGKNFYVTRVEHVSTGTTYIDIDGHAVVALILGSLPQPSTVGEDLTEALCTWSGYPSTYANFSTGEDLYKPLNWARDIKPLGARRYGNAVYFREDILGDDADAFIGSLMSLRNFIYEFWIDNANVMDYAYSPTVPQTYIWNTDAKKYFPLPLGLFKLVDTNSKIAMRLNFDTMFVRMLTAGDLEVSYFEGPMPPADFITAWNATVDKNYYPDPNNLVLAVVYPDHIYSAVDGVVMSDMSYHYVALLPVGSTDSNQMLSGATWVSNANPGWTATPFFACFDSGLLGVSGKFHPTLSRVVTSMKWIGSTHPKFYFGAYYHFNTPQQIRAESCGMSLFYPFTSYMLEKLKGAEDVRVMMAQCVYLTSSTMNKNLALSVSLILRHKAHDRALDVPFHECVYILDGTDEDSQGEDGYEATTRPYIFNNLPGTLDGGKDKYYLFGDDDSTGSTGAYEEASDPYIDEEIHVYSMQTVINAAPSHPHGSTKHARIFAGRQLFDAIPDALFKVDAGGYPIEDYEGIQVVFRTFYKTAHTRSTGIFAMIQSFPWFGENGNIAQNAIYLHTRRTLNVENDDIFVQVNGRANINPGTISTEHPSTFDTMDRPDTIFNNVMQLVDPRKNLTSQNIEGIEDFRIRTQLLSQGSAVDISEKMAKHCWGVVSMDEQDGMSIKSIDYNDYGESVVATFDEHNIVRNEDMGVTFRKMEEICRDFTFNFHYESGEQKLTRSITAKLDDNNQLVITGYNYDPAVYVGIYDSRKQMTDCIIGEFQDKFLRSRSYYAGASGSKVIDFEFAYDDIISDVQAGDWFTVGKEGRGFGVDGKSMYTVFKLMQKAMQFHLFNAWTIEFQVHMRYFIDTPAVIGRRLKIGDYICLKTWFHSDNMECRGFVKAIDPDLYDGMVKITLFCPIPPDVYARYYDPIWDGGLSNATFEAMNYQLGGIFTYPFKNGPQIGTFPDNGIADGSFNPSDYTFEDGSTADAEDPNIP